MWITRRCSTSEASSASRVSGVSLSRNPWAASRYVRSSDSAVPDNAASRFASATWDARSAHRRGPLGRRVAEAPPGRRRRARRRARRPAPRPASASAAGRRLGRAGGCAPRSARRRPAPWRRRGSAAPAAVRSSRASAAQSRAAERRAPRNNSSSGSPCRCHSWAAGARCRRTARPAASSSSHRASRGHEVSSASCVTSRTTPSTVSRRRATNASTTVRRVPLLHVQLGQGQRPADERTAVVGVGEPHEESTRGLPPLVVEREVDGLRRPGERAGDAAGLQIAGQGEAVAPAVLPGADQRRRQQRQRRRPPGDVGDDGVEELGLRGQPDRRRRPAHDVAELLLGQGWDEHQRRRRPAR